MDHLWLEEILRFHHNSRAADFKLSGLKSFLKELRNIIRKGASALTEAVQHFKKADTGLKSSDVILQGLEIKKSKFGHLVANDVPLSQLEYLLKEGNLVKLIDITKQTNLPVTIADNLAYKKLLGVTSELKLGDLTEMTVKVKKSAPHLNVVAKDVEKLPANAAKDVVKVENRLYDFFAKGTKIALVIGATTVAAGWIKKTTEERDACWMITTINGKSTSCRISTFTCKNANAATKEPCDSNVYNKYYNVTLVLMTIASMKNDDPLKVNFATQLGIKAEEFENSLDKLIDQQYEKITTFVKGLTDAQRSGVNVCGIKSVKVEKGEIPLCRMCDPTANPISTKYIDAAQYPDNVTFKCISGSTIIDTINDLVISTGHNVWDVVWDSVGNVSDLFKRFGLYVGLFIVVLVIGMLLVKYFLNKSDRPNENPYTILR